MKIRLLMLTLVWTCGVTIGLFGQQPESATSGNSSSQDGGNSLQGRNNMMPGRNNVTPSRPSAAQGGNDAGPVVKVPADGAKTEPTANALVVDEQLNAAIERCRQMDQTTPGNVQLRLEWLNLLTKAQRYAEGISVYEKWGYAPASAPIELRRKYIGLCFLSHDLEGVRRRLGESFGLKEPERTQIALHLAIYDTEWALAHKLFERFEIQHVAKALDAYKPVMAAVDQIQYHSPVVGGLLSLVPGGGLIYNRRVGAGLGMLALIGASAITTWSFARQGDRGAVPAKFFGGLTIGLCVVNISLGAASSKGYNENLDKHFMQSLDKFTARHF